MVVGGDPLHKRLQRPRRCLPIPDLIVLPTVGSPCVGEVDCLQCELRSCFYGSKMRQCAGTARRPYRLAAAVEKASTIDWLFRAVYLYFSIHRFSWWGGGESGIAPPTRSRWGESALSCTVSHSGEPGSTSAASTAVAHVILSTCSRCTMLLYNDTS